MPDGRVLTWKSAHALLNVADKLDANLGYKPGAGLRPDVKRGVTASAEPKPERKRDRREYRRRYRAQKRVASTVEK